MNNSVSDDIQYRAGEQPKLRFRSERFCRVNCNWYFNIRDGEPQGPFASLDDARVELMIFLRTLYKLGEADIAEPPIPYLAEVKFG